MWRENRLPGCPQCSPRCRRNSRLQDAYSSSVSARHPQQIAKEWFETRRALPQRRALRAMQGRLFEIYLGLPVNARILRTISRHRRTKNYIAALAIPQAIAEMIFIAI
jgi:hypothetical protein